MLLNTSDAWLTIGILAALYVLYAFPLFLLARRTRDCGAHAWMAFVPFANLVLLCWIARLSAWSAVILVVGIIPVLGQLIVALYLLAVWLMIGRRFNRTVLGFGAWILPVIGAWIFVWAIRPEPALAG